jgi:hypothetical protein
MAGRHPRVPARTPVGERRELRDYLIVDDDMIIEDDRAGRCGQLEFEDSQIRESPTTCAPATRGPPRFSGEGLAG